MSRCLERRQQREDDDTQAIIAVVAGGASLFLGILSLIFAPIVVLSLIASIVCLIFAFKAKKFGQDKTMTTLGLIGSILGGLIGSVLYRRA